MGGLAAPRCLQSDDSAGCVAKLNAGDKREGNEFDACLESSRWMTYPEPITSIFSYDDNIVVPCVSSRLTESRSIEVEGVLHLGLSFWKSIQDLVFGKLQCTGNDCGGLD